MTLDNVKISRKLAGAFAFIVLTIVALGAAIFLQVSALETRKEAVSKEHKTLETLNGLEMSMASVESSTRAYLVYQNPNYLQVIEDESKTFDADIVQLREGRRTSTAPPAASIPWHRPKPPIGPKSSRRKSALRPIRQRWVRPWRLSSPASPAATWMKSPRRSTISARAPRVGSTPPTPPMRPRLTRRGLP
ncbi:CHASE3 domain-containing protein [Brevundimonas sp. DC300-4]|uniref:CHASE3 domain-containing protein n=1 Tax=Brevundimonas sp. DC300-4 TaxID=2804594 RepID=UPI003CF343FF